MLAFVFKIRVDAYCDKMVLTLNWSKRRDLPTPHVQSPARTILGRSMCWLKIFKRRVAIINADRTKDDASFVTQTVYSPTSSSS